MQQYKVDFRVVHIQGNKCKVKDKNGKLSWYHISDINKMDKITKLICQLPDVNTFGRKSRLSFDPECIKDHGSVPNDWKCKFNPDHVKVIVGSAQSMPKQKSHPMELRSRDK